MKWTDPENGKEYLLGPRDEWLAAINAFHKTACIHPVMSAPRQRIMRDGRTEFRSQCLTCSHVGPAIKRSALKGVVEDFDLTIEQRYAKRREDEYNAVCRRFAQVAITGEESPEYQAYLQTPEWDAKRQKVLRRDAHLCQGCLDAVATDVHHLTYDHVYDEFLFELTSLCRACHDRFHFGPPQEPSDEPEQG